jgi:H+/Cl- antiporter ClcA
VKTHRNVLCVLGVACLAFAAYALTLPVPVSDNTGGPQDPAPWMLALPSTLFGLLLLVLARLVKDMFVTAERITESDDRHQT